ncbi:MAG: hypothetical protein ACRCXT_19825 [Paraclostridium sp.]
MKYIERVLENIKKLKLNNAWVLEIEKEEKKLEYLKLDYLYNKSNNSSILSKYKNTRIENANIDLQVYIIKVRGEI